MISAILCALLISQAHAAVFFAEDPNPDGADNQNEVTPLLSAPLSDAEREAFESLIQNPETETFDDGFVDGQTTPLELTFQCLTETVKATITGEGGRIEDDVKNGQYPISGRYYFRTRSDTFTVTFNTSVAAVGFYAVDIGDVRGQLSINLFATSTDTGAFNSILIGHTIEALSGSVFFFGVVDEDNPFQAITFSNSAAGRDVSAMRGGDSAALPENPAWFLCSRLPPFLCHRRCKSGDRGRARSSVPSTIDRLLALASAY